MEKATQDFCRGELVKKYEQRAFECLALYNYYGNEFMQHDKMAEDMDRRIEDAKKFIAEIKSIPDWRSSKENKDKVAGYEKDIKAYRARIDSVAEVAKKWHEKSATYREEGVRILEQIELFKIFKMKTPEEIAKDKEVKPEEKKDDVK